MYEKQKWVICIHEFNKNLKTNANVAIYGISRKYIMIIREI